MRIRLLLFLLLLSAVVFGQGSVVTLTVSKDTVWVGEPFTFSATSTCFLSFPTINVNFGDGTVLTNPGNSFSGTHAYPSAGVFTMTATDPPCMGSAASIMTVNACPRLAVLTTSLPTAAQGAAYYVQLQASGGVLPLRWSLTSGALPAGVFLNPASGVLSGSPDVPGTYTFTATVQDSCPGLQQSSATLSLVVQSACPPLSVLVSPLPNAVVGTAYAAVVQASGGVAPLRFGITAGQLPPGISLDASTGALSGVPQSEGPYIFTVQVSDSCVPTQTASRSMQIIVSAPACVRLVVPSTPPPEAVIQMAYRYAFPVLSGMPPYQWSILTGRLPSGLALSPSGELAGIPGETGPFPLTLQIADSCRTPGPQQTTLSFTLTVSPASLAIAVMPSSFGVSEEATARVNLAYAFSERHGADLSLSSPGYDLLAGEAVVLSREQPLTVSVVRGAGNASETVVIPAALLQEARRNGVGGIGVRRAFSSGQSVWTVRAEGYFSGNAGAVFGLRRVMVFFEGDGGHAVVPLGETGLVASATLWYTGTGLISGSWRVDDRILSTFNENALVGDSITLRSPPLPTFEPGQHAVILAIDRPESSFPIPEVSYTVSPAAQAVRLTAPGQDEEVGGAVAFRWDADGDPPLFSLEVARGTGEPPLFKSLTREHAYALPTEITRNWPPDTVLFWKVTAEDGARKPLAESPWGSFHFMPMKRSNPQIVVLVDDGRMEECRAWLQQHPLTIVGETALPSLAATLTLIQAGSPQEAGKIEAMLARQPFVRLAAPNRLFNSLVEETPYGEYLYPIKDLRLDRLHRQWTGKGVTVAVVDSGISVGHPDLASRIKEKDNFIGSDYREEIHGTAVAGLIGGTGQGGKGYVGIAPGAQILALRACEEVNRENPFSACQTWTLAKAVDYAIRQKADVLNLSLGGGDDPLLAQLIRAALEAGIVVVAASGNSGPDGPSAFPGTLAGVISVGATDEDGAVLPSTSRGKVDITAPGKDIFAPVPQGRYNFFTGTSMACAEVSGIAALMLEMKPGLSPAEIRQVMQETALPLEDPQMPKAGLVQPCAIAKQLAGEGCD